MQVQPILVRTGVTTNVASLLSYYRLYYQSNRDHPQREHCSFCCLACGLVHNSVDSFQEQRSPVLPLPDNFAARRYIGLGSGD